MRDGALIGHSGRNRELNRSVNTVNLCECDGTIECDNCLGTPTEEYRQAAIPNELDSFCSVLVELLKPVAVVVLFHVRTTCATDDKKSTIQLIRQDRDSTQSK